MWPYTPGCGLRGTRLRRYAGCLECPVAKHGERQTEKKVPVFAVVRIDIEVRWTQEDAVAVTEILPALDEAKREVERFNKLNPTKGVRHSWQPTRYFPEGRKTKR